MAKKNRSISNFSGTLYGVTHVDSKAYGAHVRAERGSIKPAKLNKKLKQNTLDMPKVNAQAKVVFDALKPYRGDCYDGGWWSRLVRLLKRHYKAGQLPDYSLLEGDELHEMHKLDSLMSGLTVELAMKKKEVDVQLKYEAHPSFRGEGITMYTLSVISLFIDRKALKAVTEAVEFEKLKRKGKVMPLVATLALPKKVDVVVVCVKVTGIYEDGDPSHSGAAKGMRIVKVSEL